jgi:transcriptional regulator with XRE-family HTH domain
MADKKSKEIGHVVGYTIRKLREKQGISQEELAERAGIHRTFMSHVECATRNITIYNLVKIAKALKVKPSVLLSDLE